MRSLGFATLVLLSLGVSTYAVVVYSFLPFGAALYPDLRPSFEAKRVTVLVHVFAAAFAMALGPFQFSQRLRTKYLALHRLSGRLYLAVGVLVGGISGLLVGATAYGGLASQLGFSSLAVLWLYTGARVCGGPFGRRRRPPPLDGAQLRADLRRRDAAALGTGLAAFGHCVRKRVSTDRVALLGAEPCSSGTRVQQERRQPTRLESPQPHPLQDTFMAAWLIPALKLVLPHVGTIFEAAAPVFTKKKPEEAPNQNALLQQQITELQAAASQNAAHIKDLAAQLQRTVTALEEAAEIAEAKLRRAVMFCVIAGVASAAALGVALVTALTK